MFAYVLVFLLTFNQVALGSNPSGITILFKGLAFVG